MMGKRFFFGTNVFEEGVELGGVMFPGKNNTNREKEVVIVMAGFSRVATKEDMLLEICAGLNLSSFLFDWHGLGMSSGDFSGVTVKKLVNDLKRVTCMLYAEGFEKFHLVGHSLASCVIALFSSECSNYISIGKKVLIAPALNQRLLLRYWFSKNTACQS